MVAICVRSPGFDDKGGTMFVNVLNCMVGYRLAAGRKSLTKEAKIELHMKEHIGLGQKRVKRLW